MARKKTAKKLSQKKLAELAAARFKRSQAAIKAAKKRAKKPIKKAPKKSVKPSKKPKARKPAKPSKKPSKSLAGGKKKPSAKAQKVEQVKSVAVPLPRVKGEPVEWQGYFNRLLTQIVELVSEPPGKVHTWRSSERADGVATFFLDGSAKSAFSKILSACEDSLKTAFTLEGVSHFFLSFIFQGVPSKGKFGSPDITKAGGTVETWPTLNHHIILGEAMSVLEGVLPFLGVNIIKVRVHWNPYEEAPERAG